MDIKSERDDTSTNNNSNGKTTHNQSVWLYEETLTMIDFVRSKAFLYDRKDADYNKNQKKNAAWERISQILKHKSPRECKRKWSTLRIQQRRILLQNIAKKRKSHVHWQFYEPLQFLIPHMEVNSNNDSSARSNYSDESEAEETESTSFMESASKSFTLCQTTTTNSSNAESSQDNNHIISFQQQNLITSDQSDNNATKSIVVSKADTITHSNEPHCHMHHKLDDNNFASLNYFLMDVQLQMGKLNEFAQMELKIEIQKMILEKLRKPENLRND